MKQRQIRICIFLFFVVIFLVLFYIRLNNEYEQGIIHPETTTEMPNETEIIRTLEPETPSYLYYGIEEDGRLSIYDAITKELYMNTDILIRFLPWEIKEKIADKIYFNTLEDLYDFLESYSS